MPATRATARTSPFVIAPDAMADAVSASMYTRHRATARRWLGSLAVTSTMRARPRGSRGVNSGAMPRRGRCADAKTRPARPKGAVNPGTPGSEPPLAADLAHRPVGAYEVDAPDVMSGPLLADRRFDRGREAVV